jgi:hypothetical protein
MALIQVGLPQCCPLKIGSGQVAALEPSRTEASLPQISIEQPGVAQISPDQIHALKACALQIRP